LCIANSPYRTLLQCTGCCRLPDAWLANGDRCCSSFVPCSPASDSTAGLCSVCVWLCAMGQQRTITSHRSESVTADDVARTSGCYILQSLAYRSIGSMRRKKVKNAAPHLTSKFSRKWRRGHSPQASCCCITASCMDRSMYTARTDELIDDGVSVSHALRRLDLSSHGLISSLSHSADHSFHPHHGLHTYVAFSWTMVVKPIYSHCWVLWLHPSPGTSL
jgi:hypothetical protein